MVVYRKALPEDRRQYLDFANLVFSMAHRPHDFSTLLPKVYGDGRDTAWMQNIAVDDEGHIRGLVAVMPDEMHVLDEKLRTGFVGTVSVHPYARSEGHMKALMHMAIETAVQDGTDLMMLGGQRQRYEYFGFSRSGIQIGYNVTKTNLRHALRGVDASDYAYLPMREADAALVDQAYALHKAQPVRMARAREDFICILESWTAKPYIVLNKGAFAGYLVASAELSDLTEFKLVDEAMYAPALKGWMETMDVASAQLFAATYDTALNRVLGAFAERWWVEASEQVRVLNFPKVISAFLRLNAAMQGVADGEVSLWIDGAPLSIRVEKGEVSVAKEAPEEAPHVSALQAQEMFFSPMARFNGFTAPTGWFPLPLYMNSADAF